MNKTVGITFILMVVYLFGCALYALAVHCVILINAEITMLNTIASIAFNAIIATGLVYSGAMIIEYIYRRINK